MERQEAIKTLVKGGKSAEVQDLLSKKAASAHAAYKEIADDSDLTPEAKRTRQAIAYTQIIRGVNSELAAMASKVWAGDQEDASSVFGTKGLDGDPASLAISRRDAADRVAACSNASEVRELLQRATRSGDEVLARAAVEWAVQTQHADVANEYLKTRPQHEGALQRLWDGQKAQSGQTAMSMAMAVGAIRPSDMFTMSDDSIRSVAEGAYAG